MVVSSASSGKVMPMADTVPLVVMFMVPLVASVNFIVPSIIMLIWAAMPSMVMSWSITVWVFQLVPVSSFSLLHEANIRVKQANKATNNVFFILIIFLMLINILAF